MILKMLSLNIIISTAMSPIVNLVHNLKALFIVIIFSWIFLLLSFTLRCLVVKFQYVILKDKVKELNYFLDEQL